MAKKVWGITDMPAGERAGDYADMQAHKLVGAIEAYGSRWAWTRAAHCPCVGLNTDTDQPNPNCPSCRGIGTVFFGPEAYTPPDVVGDLDEVQQAILAVDGAAIIRGVAGRFARGMTHEERFYDVIGRWRSGEQLITVRPENRLGYMDRLINLDAVIVHSEYILTAANVQEIPLRYKAIQVNRLFSDTRVYAEGTDYDVVAGAVSWRTASIPLVDSPIAIHYLTHPAWRVMDMPHSTREITLRRPNPAVGPNTPFGQPTELPIAAVIGLEMLPVKED